MISGRILFHIRYFLSPIDYIMCYSLFKNIHFCAIQFHIYAFKLAIGVHTRLFFSTYYAIRPIIFKLYLSFTTFHVYFVQFQTC